MSCPSCGAPRDCRWFLHRCWAPFIGAWRLLGEHLAGHPAHTSPQWLEVKALGWCPCLCEEQIEHIFDPSYPSGTRAATMGLGGTCGQGTFVRVSNDETGVRRVQLPRWLGDMRKTSDGNDFVWYQTGPWEPPQRSTTR